MIPSMRRTVRTFLIAVFLVVMHLSSVAMATPSDALVSNTKVTAGADGSVLLVLLHGYTLDGASLEHVRAAAEQVEGLRGADILQPDLPLGLLSMASSSRITAELLSAVDRAWADRAQRGTPYRRIVLIGHSIGGLFARKLYVAACGENADAPFEDELKAELKDLGAAPLQTTRPWAKAVDRIVLLAGMNRGWSISHHMSIVRALVMQAGTAVAHVLSWVYERPPIIFTIRRGSPFITELRLQWLAMLAQIPGKGVGHALTVQLLGTVDDLVSPDDNLDLVTGKDFVYLEVPQSGHRDVIEMGDDADGSGAAAKRRQALQEALGANVRSAVAVAPVAASLVQDTSVTDMVFVIHGIRDEGYWTSKIAYRAKLLGAKHGRIVRTETSSYGYFPMLSFLRPGARQEKVAWLMDRYVEARARYPNARFHYVGHSHGTYLLAKALEDYRAIRFDHVVFAGSVVHRAYAWNRYVPERVKAVMNFVASGDWVVGFFPKALQTVGIQDLGSAGHDGFALANTDGPVQELPATFIVGGHSAALQEQMWDATAGFVLDGTFVLPADVQVSSVRNPWIALPASVAPLIWAVIAVLVGLGFYWLVTLQVREWQKTVALILYCAFIWTVLTKV